jgi:hypothetical protein
MCARSRQVRLPSSTSASIPKPASQSAWRASRSGRGSWSKGT